MICKKCNSAIDDGARFCPHCGQDQTVVETQTAEQPVSGTVIVENDAEKASKERGVFIFGLVGFILSVLSAFGTSLLAIIFSAIGLSKASKLKKAYTTLVGKAKLGNIFAIIGLILGIIGMIGAFFSAIWVIFVILASGESSGFFEEFFEEFLYY